MTITPEMARAELQRRRSSSSSITPEMARAELMRRKQSMVVKEPAVEEVKKVQEKPQFEKTKTRALARGTRNSLAGIADLADFVATPVREGLNLIARPMGREIKPLGQEIASGIDTASGGYTAPQDNAELIEERVGRDASSMIPGMGMGIALKGMKHVPKLIESTANFLKGSNALTGKNIARTGATSALIQQHLNESPDDTLGAFGKGFMVPLAETAAGLMSKKGRSGTWGRVGESLDFNPRKVEAFREAGISPSLTDVTSSAPTKIASTSLEKIPFSGTPLARLKENQYNQILSGLELEPGQSSRTQANELVLKGAKQYHKKHKDVFDNMFSSVEKDINKMKNTNVKIAPINESIEHLTRNITTESHADDFMKSHLGKEFKDLYNTSIEHGSGKTLKELKKIYPKEFVKDEPSAFLYNKFGGEVPYWHMKHVLKKINNKITTHGLIGQEDQGELKYLAKSIANSIEQDMTPRFKDLGDKSLKNWENHKPLYSEYASGAIPNLNQMFDKDKKGAIAAFKDLVLNQKNAGMKTEMVLEGLKPEQKVELVNAINKEMGRNQEGGFSPVKWASEFNALEEAPRNLLLSPLSKPNQRKVHAIAESIGSLKSTLNEANKSATSYHTAIRDLASAAIGAVGQAAYGNVASAAALGSLLIGSRLGAEALTSPKIINWIYNGMKKKNLTEFQKYIEKTPSVGKYRKNLGRQIQSFQHDIASVEKKEDKEKK